MKTWNGFEKGINLGGWLSQWDLTDREHLETFITEQDIQDIRAMGADHVRLPVDYSLIEEEDGTPKDENFIYIDRCLEWCKKAGLHVLLDLHKTAGYAFDERIVHPSLKAQLCRNGFCAYGISWQPVTENTPILLHLTC